MISWSLNYLFSFPTLSLQHSINAIILYCHLTLYRTCLVLVYELLRAQHVLLYTKHEIHRNAQNTALFLSNVKYFSNNHLQMRYGQIDSQYPSVFPNHTALCIICPHFQVMDLESRAQMGKKGKTLQLKNGFWSAQVLHGIVKCTSMRCQRLAPSEFK